MNKTEEFILKAKKVHGDRYDYSKVNYNDAHTKVCVICPIHGEFWVTPNNHLRNKNCPKCARNRDHDQETFKEKVRKIYGDKFDLSETVYKNVFTPITIKCKKHGVFTIMPRSLLDGKCECPICKHSIKDQISLLRELRNVYGDSLDYTHTIYKGFHSPVTVTCKKHGDFARGIPFLLKGCECPKCKKEKDLMYGVGISDGDFVHHTKAYNTWQLMLRRCYYKPSYIKSPSYEGVLVCDEWKRFSNYLKWYKKHYREGYQIDKDILSKGCKIYSPETCCCVPIEINGLLIHSIPYMGECVTGVTLYDGYYRATIHIDGKNKILGTFNTEKEAYECYKRNKETLIKTKAKKFYNQDAIEKYVYDGLMNYELPTYEDISAIHDNIVGNKKKPTKIIDR